MTIINESGLYSLVLSSKLETAKHFKRRITQRACACAGYSFLSKTPDGGSSFLARVHPRLALIVRAFSCKE